ncbi:hypothetical protein FACS189419_06380 [Planctomycetales bacterium]|nr:hypothetical protein FACS189419_06380 [Planctomycetales bacterium]
MSVFDIIVIAILIALTLRGIGTGMIAQIVSVGSYFVCWLVASRFAFLIAPSIPAEEPWNQVGAMAVLFVITMIAIWFFRSALEALIKRCKLESMNKLLGGGLGFVKAVLVCMVLTFFAVTLTEASRDVVFQSKTGKYFVELITRTSAFVPKDSSELLREQLANFNNKVASRTESVSSLTAERLTPSAQPVQPSSLFTAIKDWWNGKTKEVTAGAAESIKKEIADSLPVSQETFQNVLNTASQTYNALVSPSSTQPSQQQTVQQSAQLSSLQKTAGAEIKPIRPVIDDLFTARTSTPAGAFAENSAGTSGTPLGGSLRPLESSTSLVPALQQSQQERISAEQLLLNSSQPPANAGGARTFRSR